MTPSCLQRSLRTLPGTQAPPTLPTWSWVGEAPLVSQDHHIPWHSSFHLHTLGAPVFKGIPPRLEASLAIPYCATSHLPFTWGSALVQNWETLGKVSKSARETLASSLCF